MGVENFRFFKLPGNIIIQRKNFTVYVYIPIITSLIIINKY